MGVKAMEVKREKKDGDEGRDGVKEEGWGG